MLENYLLTKKTKGEMWHFQIPKHPQRYRASLKLITDDNPNEDRWLLKKKRELIQDPQPDSPISRRDVATRGNADLEASVYPLFNRFLVSFAGWRGPRRSHARLRLPRRAPKTSYNHKSYRPGSRSEVEEGARGWLVRFKGEFVPPSLLPNK